MNPNFVMVRPIAKIPLTNFFAPLIVISKTNFNVSLRHFVFTIVGNVMGIETVRMAVTKKIVPNHLVLQENFRVQVLICA